VAEAEVEIPAAERTPEITAVETVMGPAVKIPALMPAAVTVPTALTPAAVMLPEARTVEAVTSATVIDPEVDRLAAVTTPAVDTPAEETTPVELRPPVPTKTDPAVIAAVADKDWVVKEETTDRVAAVTDPEVVTPLAPATKPEALKVPVAVTWDEVRTPVFKRPTAVNGPLEVTPATVRTPDDDTLFAVKAPTLRVEAVIEAAETAPAVDRAADCKRPVILATLATKAPFKVVVLPTRPMTTDWETEPMRTTPADPPVPASRTKSPPVLPAWPEAWPSKYVERPMLLDE
jgi:hypothetical protein